MDCSNPVKDSSRVTLASMMEASRLHKRQDLAYLDTLSQTAQRTFLGAPAPRARESGVKAEELDAVFTKSQIEIPASPKLELSFLTEVGKIPVSRLQHNGVPLHPVGVNQEGGHVSVSRVFGGQTREKALIQHALAYFEPAEVESALSRYLYTRGTAAGFQKRIKEQMTRPCVQIGRMEGCANNLKSAPLSAKKLGAQIKRLLPVDVEKLPDWSNYLEDQILDLKMSNISSAGAPYWKAKPEALRQALQAVLPMVHEAISEGSIAALYASQPELFLCEVRNKLDRYEPSKLLEKVRPYTSLPFHFQVLFSCLSQPFSKAMNLFYETKGCANAYGFSWAHGGAARLEKWATACKDGKKPVFCVYGDDADIYYRRKGALWRLAPDFKQMDGSVDLGTIKLTAEYVYSMYAEKWGENPFWRQVCSLWAEFASNPDFVVHGSTVYRKPQQDGLMTGVVGTTLFDTVKAVFAYDIWADAVLARPELFEEKHAKPFFARMGLEIKAGTWVPECVNENRAVGELWSDQKFLGLSLMYEQGPERIELVPWLPEADWLTLFLTPREDPASGKGKKEKVSLMSKQRTMFDRARGYLVTGGFSSPRIREMLNGMIDSIPLTPIMMAVQAGGGTGEVPEAMSATEEDFVWPSSEGVPNELWCRNLYFSDDNQFSGEDAKWLDIAPGMTEALVEYKKNYKPLVPRMVKLEVKLESFRESLNKDYGTITSVEANPPKNALRRSLGISATEVLDTTQAIEGSTSVLVRSRTLTLGVPLEVTKEADDELVLQGCEPISGKESKAWHRPQKIPAKSEAKNIIPRAGERPIMEPVKFQPTQGQVLRRLFETRSQSLDPFLGAKEVAAFISEDGADDRFSRASAAAVVMGWLNSELAAEARLTQGPIKDLMTFVEKPDLRHSMVCSLMRYIPVPVAAELLGKTSSQIRTLAKAESLVLLNEGPGYILDAIMPAVEPLRNAEMMAQAKPRIAQERTVKRVQFAPETYKTVVEKNLVKKPAPPMAPQPAFLVPTTQVDVKMAPPQLTKMVNGWPATPQQLLHEWSEKGSLVPKLATMAKYCIKRDEYRVLAKRINDEDEMFNAIAIRLASAETVALVKTLFEKSGIDPGNPAKYTPVGDTSLAEAEKRLLTRGKRVKEPKQNNRARTSRKEVDVMPLISFDEVDEVDEEERESEEVVQNQQELKAESAETPLEIPEPVRAYCRKNKMDLPRFEIDLEHILKVLDKEALKRNKQNTAAAAKALDEMDRAFAPTTAVSQAPILRAERKLGPSEKLSLILGSPKRVAKGELAEHVSFLKAPADGLPRYPEHLPKKTNVGIMWNALSAWAAKCTRIFTMEIVPLDSSGVAARLYINAQGATKGRALWMEERGFNQIEAKEKIVDGVLQAMQDLQEDGNVSSDIRLQPILDKLVKLYTSQSGTAGMSGVLRRGVDVLFEFEGNKFTPVGNIEPYGVIQMVGDRPMWTPPGAGNPIDLHFSPRRTQQSVLKTFHQFIPDLSVARYV